LINTKLAARISMSKKSNTVLVIIFLFGKKSVPIELAEYVNWTPRVIKIKNINAHRHMFYNLIKEIISGKMEFRRKILKLNKCSCFVLLFCSC